MGVNPLCARSGGRPRPRRCFFSRCWRQGASGQSVVRREFSSLAVGERERYATAVRRLKEKPEEDPESWKSLSDIHANHCPHGNWYFLPWHRAYLLKFEQACRHALGDPSYALPYWDWTKHPALPAEFWREPLIHGRGIRPGDRLDPSAVGRRKIDQILRYRDFVSFGSRPSTGLKKPGGSGTFEVDTHNYVHGRVGGETGDMGHVETSARDPIFWLHHANIDRIWADWNDLGRLNPTAPAWRTAVGLDPFVHSANPPGIADARLYNPADVDVVRSLGYRYDTQTPDAPDVRRREVALSPREGMQASFSPTFAGVEPRTATSSRLQPPAAFRELLRGAAAAGGEKVVRLKVEGVELKAGQAAAVYLNWGSPQEKFDAESPSLLGIATAFPHKEGAGGHAMTDAAPPVLVFEANEALSVGRPAENLWVTVFTLDAATRRPVARLARPSAQLEVVE